MGLKISEMVQIIAQNGDSMKDLKRKMLCRHGISSLELAVVLALIAIMATFTIPYLGSWLKHYRIVGASREVASTLQKARIKAVSDNLEWRIVIDQDRDTYWLERGNSASGSSTWTMQGSMKSLPEGVLFTDVNGANATGQFSIQFNPSGTANSGSVYLKGETGERFRLTILSTTGRIWIRVKRGSGWEPV